MKNNKNFQLFLGLALAGILMIFLVIFPLFLNISIEINIEYRLAKPSHPFLLGTDELGRDVISTVIFASWISLITGVSVVSISLLVGVTLGLISGLSAGKTDLLIMRIADIILSFPGILLAIVLVSVLNRSFFNLVFALSFYGWVGVARLVRGEVLKYREKEFILAARSINGSPYRIAFCHLLPLLRPHIIVHACLGLSNAILAESSLNFLGIGLKPLCPTLGQLIDNGRDHLFDRPSLIIIPGVTLFILIIAVNLIGDGIRGRMDHSGSISQ